MVLFNALETKINLNEVQKYIYALQQK